MTNMPSWLYALGDSIFDKCIQLILFSYDQIRINPHNAPPKENQRRNELIREMRRHKLQFGLVQAHIVSESGEFDDHNKDIGRNDLVIFCSTHEEEGIVFECKRFLKGSLIPSDFQSKYSGEGIHRFIVCQYAAAMPIAGMIAFIEAGDYQKAYQLFKDELPKTVPKDSVVLECSNVYQHRYIFRTTHLRKNNKNISLTHILMDFTSKAASAAD